MYIYTHISLSLYIYIYIYICRERGAWGRQPANQSLRDAVQESEPFHNSNDSHDSNDSNNSNNSHVDF